MIKESNYLGILNNLNEDRWDASKAEMRFVL